MPDPVTDPVIAPRLLSRLRIKHPVTRAPARLNTWPVDSGFQDGIPPVRICSIAQPQPCLTHLHDDLDPYRVVFISHLLQVCYQVFGRLQGGLSLHLIRLPTLVDYRVPFL